MSTQPRASLWRSLAVAALSVAGLLWAASAPAQPSLNLDVNRPRSPFDCDLPIGISWYGSKARCLQELCAGQNVFNEFVFDDAGRRRKNPCYGQSPSEAPIE